MKLQLAPGFFLLTALASGHPMGDSSVNHYARIETSEQGAHIRYVLDLAERPASELLRQWGLDARGPRGQLDAKAAEQMRVWVGNLSVTVSGRSLIPRIDRTTLEMGEGTDRKPVMRIGGDLEIAAVPGPLEYEDRNYPGQPGWKEIVTAGRDADRSRELTAYPRDSAAAAPQDLRVELDWRMGAPPERRAIAASQLPAAPAPGTRPQDDYLARLLHQQQLGWGMMLIGMAVAFGLGAVHALSPGHGKTIVAAYLVGTRGTARHAAFLGGMVTFTHTISVFFLGFVTLFLSQYVLPQKIYPVLGAISGISIVWIGGTLLYQRWRKLRAQPHEQHHHQHDRDHPHAHAHAHGLVHDHGDGHVHSHVPEGDITLAGLIALGASGGLVPCPSALVLLLSSISLDRVGLGLLLLVAFSGGLAVVLMGIGLAVLYAKHLLPDSDRAARNPAFRIIPVVSAAVIVCVGLIMTGVSLGFIHPDRFLAGV